MVDTCTKSYENRIKDVEVLFHKQIVPPVLCTGLNKQKILAKIDKYFLTHHFEHILGAQKNRPIETVLLSMHNICFG